MKVHEIMSISELQDIAAHSKFDMIFVHFHLRQPRGVPSQLSFSSNPGTPSPPHPMSLPQTFYSTGFYEIIAFTLQVI